MTSAKKSALVAASLFLAGLTGAFTSSGVALGAGEPAVVVAHTYTGTVAPGTPWETVLNCATLGQGYVEGAGYQRRFPREDVVQPPGALRTYRAEGAEPDGDAFAIKIRLEAFSNPGDFRITVYCTSDKSQAWRP
jgi:hypothetical protein